MYDRYEKHFYYIGRWNISLARKAINITDGSRSITSTILLLAWPVFLEQIFTTLISYADTAMVGSMGAVATASVSISNSPIFLLNGIIMALGVGITSLVARSVGQNNTEQVKSIIRHSILAVIFIGIPITVIIIALHRAIPLWMGAEPDVLELASRYNLIVGFGRFFNITAMTLNSAYRGYGDTKTPLIVNSLMNIVNVILNFLLIYPIRKISVLGLSFTMWGAGLGVEGAAIATSIGMATSGLLALWVAFFRKNEYRINFKDSWSIDMPLTKQIFSISFPAMLERIFMSSSGILTSSTIATLGTVVVAANSLQLTAESMSYMPAFAFQTAIVTLVGQSLGAKKPDLAVKFIHRTLLMGISLMVLTNIGLFTLRRQLIGLFTSDEAVIAMGAECLKVVAFMQVPQVISWTFSGVLRGAGDTKYSFYVTAGTEWGIRTLFTVLVIRLFHLGLVQVQIVILVEQIVRMCLYFLRYKSGKWQEVFEKQNAQI